MDQFIFNLEIANSSQWIIGGKIGILDAKIAQKTKRATVEYRHCSHCGRKGDRVLI
jgi:hypothetical protein